MIIGTHLLLYSADPLADRNFLRDVLDFKYVDTGHDWLIFKFPSCEAGVHPLEGPNTPPEAAAGEDGSTGTAAGPTGGFAIATVWLMVEDIEDARNKLADKGVETGEAVDEGWGIHTSFALPSGARLGLYQPRHELAINL